jgi:predicted phage terminase large subunit-like protein
MTGVGIDLAISMRDTADFTAMVCARIVGGVMYVLPNPVNEHLTFPDTIERVKTINNAFGTKERRHIYVENVGYQEAAIQQLNKDGVRVEGVNPQGQDKRARIALTTHNIKSGLILFPKHGAEELIRQLVGFGKESHDDLADAFTILAIKFSEYLHVPTASIFFLEGDPEDRGWHSFLQGLPTTNGIRTKQF